MSDNKNKASAPQMFSTEDGAKRKQQIKSQSAKPDSKTDQAAEQWMKDKMVEAFQWTE